MKWFTDIHNRKIRLTPERQKHIENDHPEMSGQIDKIRDALLSPDIIVRSRIDSTVELFYRYHKETPVTEKYICIIAKDSDGDLFIVTAYFTESVKRGKILWEKK